MSRSSSICDSVFVSMWMAPVVAEYAGSGPEPAVPVCDPLAMIFCSGKGGEGYLSCGFWVISLVRWLWLVVLG